MNSRWRWRATSLHLMCTLINNILKIKEKIMRRIRLLSLAEWNTMCPMPMARWCVRATRLNKGVSTYYDYDNYIHNRHKRNVRSQIVCGVHYTQHITIFHSKIYYAPSQSIHDGRFDRHLHFFSVYFLPSSSSLPPSIRVCLSVWDMESERYCTEYRRATSCTRNLFMHKDLWPKFLTFLR